MEVIISKKRDATNNLKEEGCPTKLKEVEMHWKKLKEGGVP